VQRGRQEEHELLATSILGMVIDNYDVLPKNAFVMAAHSQMFMPSTMMALQNLPQTMVTST
jgi:hypothetical protein